MWKKTFHVTNSLANTSHEKFNKAVGLIFFYKTKLSAQLPLQSFLATLFKGIMYRRDLNHHQFRLKRDILDSQQYPLNLWLIIKDGELLVYTSQILTEKLQNCTQRVWRQIWTHENLDYSISKPVLQNLYYSATSTRK